MFYQISTCRKRCASEGTVLVDRAIGQPPGTSIQRSHPAHEQPYLARRQNWVNQLERHALMQPEATALRFLGNTLTWADLHRRVGALAGALSRRGVGFGDRVMILMLNRTEFVESVLAANMLGAIAVPLNFRLTPPKSPSWSRTAKRA